MTQIVVISHCCFAQNDLEMYNVLKRKWWAIVLPIRSFFGGKFLLFCERICHQFPTKFCHGLPNLKTQSSCLGAGQIFVRREIWQICQLTGIDLKENTHQENLISIFSRSISIRSPPKLFLSYAAIKRWKIEDSYLGMLHNDPYSEYNYYGSQVYFPIASPGLSTVPYISAKVVDSASTSYRISYP